MNSNTVSDGNGVTSKLRRLTPCSDWKVSANLVPTQTSSVLSLLSFRRFADIQMPTIASTQCSSLKNYRLWLSFVRTALQIELVIAGEGLEQNTVSGSKLLQPVLQYKIPADHKPSPEVLSRHDKPLWSAFLGKRHSIHNLSFSMDGWLRFNGILSTQVAAISRLICLSAMKQNIPDTWMNADVRSKQYEYNYHTDERM